jgi:cysteine desulfurase/selenocysteine lyase
MSALDAGRIRRDFPVLGRKVRGRPLVYFDNACMSLKSSQVIRAMLRYYEEYPACAGRSIHSLSSMVEAEVAAARKRMAGFVGARKAEEMVFTRNTTEGINLVAGSLGLGKGDVVVTSDREHNSNLIPWQLLVRRRGVVHRVVRSREDGTFDLEAFREAARGAKLVSVVHTSNLDGYTLPLREIAGIARDAGALVMADGAQSVPHRDVHVRKLGLDFLAFSGHKMTGPTGTGVLYGRQELLEGMGPFMVGGETVATSTYTSHELLGPPEKFEAGLQDYAGIIGLGAAADYLQSVGRDAIGEHDVELNRAITEGLEGLEGLRVLGPADPGMRSGIFSFVLEGMDHHQVAMLLDQNASVMVRSGQHCCHSWFDAHGLDGSVRASLYMYNTAEEAGLFVEELRRIARLR